MPTIAETAIIDAFTNLLHGITIPELIQRFVLQVTHRRGQPGGTAGKSGAIFFKIKLLEWVGAESAFQWSGSILAGS